jgi:hypothetical protein
VGAVLDAHGGRSKGSGPVAWVAALALVAALTAWVQGASRELPYYVSWDMDLVAALDVLAIGGGELPDHVAHPGFGAYWLWSWTVRDAGQRGGLGATSYDQLETALDPLLVTVELTDFLRAHSPFVSLAIPLLLALTVIALTRARPWVAVVALAVLAVQEPLLYHASLIRSGTYAVAFWAAACWLLALAGDRPRAREGLLLGAGVLLGLALLTKIQAVFLLAAAPGVLVLALARAPDAPWGGPPERPVVELALAWAVAISLVLLLLLAHGYVVPSGKATWTEDYALGPLGWVALAAVFGQLGLVYRARRRPEHPAGWVVSRWGWVSAGCALAFALHFGVFEAPSRGWEYLLLNAKLLFFRGGDALGDVAFTQRLEWFALALGYAPVTFGAHVVLLAAALGGRAAGWVRLGRAEAWTLGALSGLAGALILWGTRFNQRDLLWEEALLNTLTVVLALTVARRLRGPWRRPLAACAGLVLCALLLSGWSRCQRVEARLAANYNLYGWRSGMWERAVFKPSQTRYTDLIESRTGDAESRRAALRRATTWRALTHQARSVFPNQPHTSADVGLLRAGWAVWRDSERRLQRVPESLRDLATVDCATPSTTPDGLLIPRTVRHFNERRDKLAPPRDGRLAVLTRSDLRLVLFLHPDDVEATRAAYQDLLDPTGQTLELEPEGDDDGRRVGVRVLNYVELQPERWTRRPVFVIASDD